MTREEMIAGQALASSAYISQRGAAGAEVERWWVSQGMHKVGLQGGSASDKEVRARLPNNHPGGDDARAGLRELSLNKHSITEAITKP